MTYLLAITFLHTECGKKVLVHLKSKLKLRTERVSIFYGTTININNNNFCVKFEIKIVILFFYLIEIFFVYVIVNKLFLIHFFHLFLLIFLWNFFFALRFLSLSRSFLMHSSINRFFFRLLQTELTMIDTIC